MFVLQERGFAWTLFVKATLKPLETAKITLRPKPGRQPVAPEPHTAASTAPIKLAVAHGAEATVDPSSGSLLSIGDTAVNCSLEYYTPAVGSPKSHGWGNTDDCSTAYAFRPMPGVPVKPFGPDLDASPRVYRGALVQQSHVVVDAAAGVELAVRVLAGDDSVHLVGSFGPLDVSNGFGQEAVVRLGTGTASAGQW